MTKDMISSDVLITFHSDGTAIFAKNSHRPRDEVQEINFVKGGKREDSKLKCTYIEIDESVNEVNSTILSKPVWTWGAEMGSNNKNVSIGNIVLKSSYNTGEADSTVKRLIGMDLVRLALERGSSAEECVEVIGDLLENYGQGGPCTEESTEIGYHNSFVIADPKNAWVLEACGPYWAAQKITTSKHIKGYTITTSMDKTSTNLKEKAKELQLWDGTDEFNFSKCFSASEVSGDLGDDAKLDELKSKSSYECTLEMFKIMRSKNVEICNSIEATYPTQSSQVSILNNSLPSIHWFTGTPDPRLSVYKPFIFTPNAQISHHTISSTNNRSHTLFDLHAKQPVSDQVQELLFAMENMVVVELAEVMHDYVPNAELNELDELMKDCVETETKFYR